MSRYCEQCSQELGYVGEKRLCLECMQIEHAENAIIDQYKDYMHIDEVIKLIKKQRRGYVWLEYANGERWAEPTDAIDLNKLIVALKRKLTRGKS